MPRLYKGDEEIIFMELGMSMGNGSLLSQIFADVATHFFHQVYTFTNPSEFTHITYGFSPKVQNTMNVQLSRAATYEEIKNVVFSINPNKALGDDGLTAIFFQKHWNITREEVCGAITEFFDKGKILCSINHTLIALIQKSSMSKP